MKYLVLGSAGLIGTYLCQHLRDHKQEVIEFDLEYNDDLRIYGHSLLRKYMSECDFVYFLAFDVGGSRYLKEYQNSYNFISNNVKIMNTTFDMLHLLNKPFLFTSSQMSNMTHSNYGVLKLLGEKYTNQLGGIVTKFWNVYGIEKDVEKFHVIPDLILKGLREKHIDILTTGQEKRQFLSGFEAADALYKLSQFYKNIPRNRELHITSFKWTSIFDLARMISAYLGDIPVNRGEGWDSIQGIINEPDDFVLNYWKPTLDLEYGLKHIIDHYKASYETKN